MSHAHTPHSSTSEFSLYIKAVGKSCSPELRCPKPLDLGFGATYYDLEDPNTGGSNSSPSPSQTPWVGTVELEEWYYDQYSSDLDEHEPPIHPGYRVAPVGQLQMIVKNSTNAIKVFLVPYDLRQIPVGGRLLARERTFIHNSNAESTTNDDGSGSPKGKKRESLRYAYQLQFICLPLSTQRSESSTTRQTSTQSNSSERAYYLSKSLRIVFTSTPPESDQETRIEREDEIVPPSDLKSIPGRRRSSLGQLQGKILEDWNLIRRKWYARRKMGDQSESALEIEEEEEEKEEEEEVLPPIRSPSRASTPVPQPFNVPNLPTKQTPPPPRIQRRQLRRTSAEERELSEKLRKMALE